MKFLSSMLTVTCLATTVTAEDLIVFDSQYIPKRSEYRNIFVIRPDGTGLRQITHFDESTAIKHARTPAWSKDRKQIFFESEDPEGQRKRLRHTVDVDGKNLRQVEGRMAPDGKSLVYQERTNDRRRPAVFIKDLESEQIRRLSPPRHQAVLPYISPKGDKVVYTDVESWPNPKLFVVDLATAEYAYCELHLAF